MCVGSNLILMEDHKKNAEIIGWLPGQKRLLSLSLSVVSLLFIIVIISEATMFPWTVSLVGPVVAVIVVSLSGPGARAATAGTSYADTSDGFRLSETTVPLFVFSLFVARFRKFWPKAIWREAPIATATTTATARTRPRSSGSRAPWIPAAIGARAIRH